MRQRVHRNIYSEHLHQKDWGHSPVSSNVHNLDSHGLREERKKATRVKMEIPSQNRKCDLQQRLSANYETVLATLPTHGFAFIHAVICVNFVRTITRW